MDRVKIGQRFGYLTIVGVGQCPANVWPPKAEPYWVCRCDCTGNSYKTVREDNLFSGAVTSCGCVRTARREYRRRGYTTSHPLHSIWYMAKRRCRDPRDAAYPRYGGRGITFHEGWDEFGVFAEYIEAMLGPRPTEDHSIDRIDNDRGYAPGNLRWATPQQQADNSRDAAILVVFGENMSVAAAAVRLGVSESHLRGLARMTLQQAADYLSGQLVAGKL